jgi:NAD(P)-dependent dehydrogenase (short-subunit alcohol dehydrogenase family)
MSRLAGKVALITGAPKGIGTATRQRIGRGRGVGAVTYASDRSSAEAVSRQSPPPVRPVLGRYSQKENQ